MSEKRKGVVFCSYTGKWKEDLEKRLQTSDKVTLTALGRVRYKLLAYSARYYILDVLTMSTRLNICWLHDFVRSSIAFS